MIFNIKKEAGKIPVGFAVMKTAIKDIGYQNHGSLKACVLFYIIA